MESPSPNSDLSTETDEGHIGDRDLAKLAVAIERDLARTAVPAPTEEATILVTA